MAQNQFTDFEIDADLSEVNEWGGEQRPLPPQGDYTLLVTNVEQKNAKSSGNNMITVEFTIQDEGEANGLKAWNNYVLTAAAMGRVKQLMIAVGGSLDGKIRASEIMGATIRGTITHSEVGGGTDANGNPLAPKTFANVMNELPLEETKPAVQQKAATTPPVARGGQQKAGGANGARRA